MARRIGLEERRTRGIQEDLAVSEVVNVEPRSPCLRFVEERRVDARIAGYLERVVRIALALAKVVGTEAKAEPLEVAAL
jgi:hypothetical protein